MTTTTEQVRRRISMMFLELDPSLRVAMLDDIPEAAESVLIASADTDDELNLTAPILNPVDKHAAEYLRSLFFGYRSFNSFSPRNLVILVSHLSTLMDRFDLQKPDLWARILQDPTLIENLCKEDEDED